MRIKQLKTKTLFLALIMACSTAAVADQTTSANYSVILYTQISASMSQQPNFGIISLDTSQPGTGSVDLATLGDVVTPTGTGVFVETNTGAQSGILHLVGQADANVVISITPSISLAAANGAAGVTVTPILETNIALLSNIGVADVGVGGTLNLPALDTVGLTDATAPYTGSATITVSYQ